MCDVRPVGISQVLLKTSGPVSVLIVLMSQPFKDLMHCEIILSLIQISTLKKYFICYQLNSFLLSFALFTSDAQQWPTVTESKKRAHAKQRKTDI